MGLFAYKVGGLPGSSWAEYERQRSLAHAAWLRNEAKLRNTPEYRARAEAAQQRALDRMDAQIKRSAIRVVKARARAYLQMPGQLEMVERGLSYATATLLIDVGRSHLDAERKQATSGADLIVPVRAANARALMVMGRYLRRFESRTQMQEAAE